MVRYFGYHTDILPPPPRKAIPLKPIVDEALKICSDQGHSVEVSAHDVGGGKNDFSHGQGVQNHVTPKPAT